MTRSNDTPQRLGLLALDIAKHYHEVLIEPSTPHLSSRTAGAKPASANSTNRAAEPRLVRSVETIKGARQASGQTNFRAASTIECADLSASGVLYSA
jgi:hypothetical protein